MPVFQPPYSPELNPVEHIWHHIRETYNFKNKTFNSIQEVEDRLVVALNELDEKTVKSINRFNWIYKAIC